MLMLRKRERRRRWKCWKKRQLHSMTFPSRRAICRCRDSYTCVMNIHTPIKKKTF
jgi:hypothetical protein